MAAARPVFGVFYGEVENLLTAVEAPDSNGVVLADCGHATSEGVDREIGDSRRGVRNVKKETEKSRRSEY